MATAYILTFFGSALFGLVLLVSVLTRKRSEESGGERRASAIHNVFLMLSTLMRNTQIWERCGTIASGKPFSGCVHSKQRWGVCDKPVIYDRFENLTLKNTFV